MERINESKASGIDNLSGKFLKDGASVLSGPIADLCNLSILVSSFPSNCKIKITLQKGVKNRSPKL